MRFMGRVSGAQSSTDSECGSFVRSRVIAGSTSRIRRARRAALDLDRLATEPGDLVGVLVASAGEADDEDLAGPEPAGLLERLGHGVARLERGRMPFVAGR